METDVIGGKPDQNFYQNLKAFHQFEQFTDRDNYNTLPDDWYVGVTDITNSTELFEQDKFRLINIVGVSPIVGILNHHKAEEVPFVFGGDGCLIAVPESSKELLRSVLKTTAFMAEKQFGINLRTALFKAKDINRHKPILVAKYKVSKHYSQAILYGGGAELAEEWLKTKPDKHLEAEEDRGISFEGLECRWKPVKSPSGITLTLLLKVNQLLDEKEQLEVYRDFFKHLNELPSAPEERHPIREELMLSEFGLLNYKTEVDLKSGHLPSYKRISRTLKAWALTMIGIVMMKRGTKTSETDWSVYKSDLVKNADIRKFDDMLRMVISCTDEQKRRIEAYLKHQHQNKQLNYGLHSSDSALITCMVFKYHKKHIHFVDGNHGGYTAAASMLKKQMYTGDRDSGTKGE